MMTSLSDMQRLHNQSETNTSRSISGSIDRTRPSHQLDFQQAMRDFKFMFPTMEEEVIEAVLRANNGIVDATVDQLLTMSVDIRDCLKEGDDCDNVEDNDLIDTKSVINNLALNQLKSINGVKLKPSHKLDANCCDMLQMSSAADSSLISVDSVDCGDDSIFLSPSVPAKPIALDDTVPSSSVACSDVASKQLPLLIDAPISDFLCGLPSYSSRQVNITSKSVQKFTPSEQTVSSIEKPVMNAPIASKILPADSSSRSLQGRKLYRWNPPLLGQLPHDFLRIIPEKPLPVGVTHKSSSQHTLQTMTAPKTLVAVSGNSGSKSIYRTPQHSRNTASLSRSMTDARHHSHHRQMHGTDNLHNTGGDVHAVRSTQNVSRSHTVSRPLGGRQEDLIGSSKSVANNERHGSRTVAHAGGDQWLMPVLPPHHISHHQTPQVKDVQSKSERSKRNHETASNEMGEVISPYLRHKMAENERRLQEVDVNNDPDVLQMLKDERLALILQNEEFLNELRNDKDFMKVLERDRLNATAFEPEPNFVGDTDDHNLAVTQTTDSSGVRDENAEFRRQLKYMGGSSRKTLMAKAKQFFSRKKKAHRPVLIKGPLGVSTVHLLDDEENEEAGLAQPQTIEEEEWVPQHITVQRPLNSSDVVINKNTPSDIC